MIHIHQVPKLKDKDYSSSPFCMKLELYLKAMNLNYENHFNLEFNKSPTGKMPYIEMAGKKFADSNLIIQMLEQQNQNSIDKHLSLEQKAISTAFIRLCEDSLYYAGVYSRWIDKNNDSWKKDFLEATSLPKVMATIIYPVAKKNILRQLKAVGVTKLTNTEIYAKAEKDLQAIADFIGSKKYFFNDKVSLVDLVVFSFIKNIGDGSCGKKMQSLVDQLKISTFLEAMQNEFDIR